ncbi:hypothetical protein SDC9_168270 [bioreactor metagenome]|uniref:Uncharacterized protein n=1 Tax=bioreactor metagenome TaxID=1076179 RepID=A0A645G235_9ZZZZ
MVSDIDSVAVAFRIRGFTALYLQAEQRCQATKHMPEGRDVFWVTRAEQAVKRTENTNQNGIDNGNNKSKNK